MSGVGRVLTTLQSFRPVPTVRAATCTRRYGSECTDCVTACPVQAVTIGVGRDAPLVDAVTCIGCGLCAAACPVDVFEGVGAAPERLVEAARAAGDRLSLRCSKAAAAPAQDVTYVQDVFCLGSLHPETVAAAAAAMRPGGRLELVSATCGTCPVNASRQVESTTSAGQALARRVTPGVDVERRTTEPVVVAEQDPAAAQPVARRSWWRRGRARRSGTDPVAVSRRDLFARLSGQPAATGEAVGASSTDAPAAARGVAPSRPRAALLAVGGDVPLPRPHVAQGCTACRGCSGACPTDALRWDQVEGGSRLEVDPRACIACGECVRVCPEDVMGLVCDLVPTRVGAAVPLITVQGSHCEQCGALLSPGDQGRCTRCASRESLLADVWAQYPTEPDPR